MIASILYFFLALAAAEIVWAALWSWLLFAMWLASRVMRDRGVGLPRARVVR